MTNHPNRSTRHLELDSSSIGHVTIGDIVTVREIKSYARGRDDQDGRYATIVRTSTQDFDTGNGAIDFWRSVKTVHAVINDGQAVIVAR